MNSPLEVIPDVHSPTVSHLWVLLDLLSDPLHQTVHQTYDQAYDHDSWMTDSSRAGHWRMRADSTGRQSHFTTTSGHAYVQTNNQTHRYMHASPHVLSDMTLLVALEPHTQGSSVSRAGYVTTRRTTVPFFSENTPAFQEHHSDKSKRKPSPKKRKTCGRKMQTQDSPITKTKFIAFPPRAVQRLQLESGD